MTLLSIINDAQVLLNLPVTTTVVTNTGEAQKQLLGIANVEGRALSRSHPWQNLTAERNFTTVAAELQTETLPADFGWIVDESMYNRTTTQPVLGPLSGRVWQGQKAYGTSLTWPQFRIRGNSFYFLPAPPASESIYYEYVSKYWCESSGGTDQERWAADTDVGRLDEYVMTLGIVWRWNKSKGHAYQEDYEEYEKQRLLAISRDGSRKTLNVGGRQGLAGIGIGAGRIREGSWS